MRKILDFLKSVFGEKILLIVIGQLITKDNIIKGLDAVLDVLEDLAAKTETKVDDEALKKLRAALNIPDNDAQ